MLSYKILSRKKNEFWIFFVVLCLLSLLMIIMFMPLNIISPGDDISFHHRRFMALVNSLNNGSFPVYLDYSDTTKYGFGSKWFYSDFIFIPFALIATFTGFIFSYKLMWFVMTVLCGLFTYKMVNRIYKNNIAAYFAALIYTFSSYRLQDVFERAAVGEALAFTFMPIVFWGLYEIIKGDYKKWYIISIGFTLLIFTHLISTALTFLTVVIFILIYYNSFSKEPRRLIYLFIAGMSTIFLSAYFLFPFIEQLAQIKLNMSQMEYMGYREDRAILSRFVKSTLFPHSLLVQHSMNPCLGISMIICIALRFFVKEKTKFTRSIDIGVLVGLVYFILTFNIFNWNTYPLKAINFIQFSWRLFQFCTFFFSIAGGYYLAIIATKSRKKVLIGMTLVVLISLQLFTQSNSYKSIKSYSRFPTTSMAVVDIHGYFRGYREYFSVNYNDDYTTKKGNSIDTESEAKLSNIIRKDGYISLDIETINNNIVEFPLTFYKGYNATLNNENIKVEESKYGLAEVPIDRSGKLVIQFTGTTIQRYSIYITLISCLLLIIYIIIDKKKHYEY